MLLICRTIVILACVGASGLLVLAGHPWFALFLMIVAAGNSRGK